MNDRPARREKELRCLRCHERKRRDEFAAARPRASRSPKKQHRRGNICQACRDLEDAERADRLRLREVDATTWKERGRWRRKCRTCGEAKLLSSEFYVSKREAKVTTRRYCYECKCCAKARINGRAKALRRDPELAPAERARSAASMRRWRLNNDARYRENLRRHRERVLADPERHARKLELQRMNRRLRREREGLAELEVPSGHHGRYPAGDAVPSGPLIEVVEAEQARRGCADGLGPLGSRVEHVASDLGTSDKRVRAWRDGSEPEAPFDLADAVITRAGLLWWDVYDPEDHPEAAALFGWRPEDELAPCPAG